MTQPSRSLAGEFVRKERGRIGREGENKERTLGSKQPREEKAAFIKDCSDLL